jgi:hypothetical protein
VAFAVISFAPFSFSQPTPMATPQAEETPGPESLLPAGAKMLQVQWGNFRGTKARDLLILYRTPDLSGTHAAVYTRHKGRFSLLWEQTYSGQPRFDDHSGAYLLDPSSKIPFLILAPLGGKGGEGSVLVYRWNGKAFEKLPSPGTGMLSLDIQDLKGDKRLEIICTEQNGQDQIYVYLNGGLVDQSASFPDYYKRSAGAYYPEKQILLDTNRVNRLEIYVAGYDQAGKALAIPKPGARLWLVDEKGKDLSINIPDFQMSGNVFKARADDSFWGGLSIYGKFLDGKFGFRTRPHANRAVLICDIRLETPDHKLYLPDNSFTY